MHANTTTPSLPAGPGTSTEELGSIFTADPFAFLAQCYQTWGELFTLELGDFGVHEHHATGQWVFLCNADHLKRLLKADSTVQLAGRANQIQFQKILPDEGSLMLDGAAHAARRKILGRVLQGERKIRDFTDPIRQATLDEIAHFPATEAFPLAPCFRRIAAHMMRRLTFGALDDEAIDQVTHNVCRFGDPSVAPEQKKPLIEQSTAVLGKVLSACPHAAQGNATLLAALNHAWQAEKSLSKADVQAELMTVMLAGVDTTAATLAWITSQILSRAAVWAKVQAELSRVLGQGGAEAASAAQFDQMPYLDAVIHETTRLCPLFFTTTPRLLISPLQMGDYLLPPGTIVASAMNVIHTRPDYYPDPLAFRPERFIDSKPDPYRYIFFGGGIRRCPGMGFALYEIKVILATLLHSCRLEPVDVNTARERHGSFFAPKGSIVVKLAG